jgi:competence protein ComEC
LAEIFNNANYLVLGVLQAAVDSLGRIPGGHLFVKAPPTWWAVLYYAGLLLALAPRIARPWRLRLVLVGAPLVALTWMFVVDRDRGTVITVLDLYRGQAVFVDVAGEHDDFLVDTGDDHGGARIVVPFLHAHGVDRLDRVIVSRPTKAHVGGFDALSRMVPFRRVLDNGLPVRSAYYDRWRERLDTGSWETDTLRAGDSWETRDGMTVRVLHPPRDWNRPRSADNALVLALEQDRRRVLLLPSAGETVERALLTQPPDQLRADVIVRGTHGREPSCTEPFLDVVKPRVVVLAGPAGTSRFGVRDPVEPDLVDRLRNRSIEVFRTAESGAIRIRLNERGYSIEPWL